MKKNFLNFIKGSALLLILAPSTVMAGLILDITDNGGFAKFSLSGSDTFTIGGNFNNGSWISNSDIPGLFNFTGSSAQVNLITSGSGSITLGGHTGSIDRVHWNGLAFSNTFSLNYIFANLFASIGEAISWTGELTSTLSFDRFNAGTYTTNRVGYQNTTLSDGLTVNVGGSVPAPATFALMGLGLLGLGYNRKKSA